jgi:hypothetical protein
MALCQYGSRYALSLALKSIRRLGYEELFCFNVKSFVGHLYVLGWHFFCRCLKQGYLPFEFFRRNAIAVLLSPIC